jgi:hypothetical protein
MSLVVTNLGDDNVEIFGVGKPQVIADVGGVAVAERVSGLARCGVIAHSSGVSYFEACTQEATTPSVVDAGNSITVIVSFPTRPQSEVCSVDFSMLAGVRRTGSRSQDRWRQITIGLPNIRVC